MLILPKQEMVVGTSSKCGSWSWESLLMGKHGARKVNPRHLMVPPAEFSTWSRALTVRDPYDRLVSMFHYLTTPFQRPPWLGTEAQGKTFDEFVPWLAQKRMLYRKRNHNPAHAPWVFLTSLSENADMLESEFALPLDRPGIACMLLGIESQPLPRKNVTSRRPRVLIDSYFTKQDTLDIANDIWCESDCRRFDYKMRRKANG